MNTDSYQKAMENLEEYRDKMLQYEMYNSLFDGRNSFSNKDNNLTFMHNERRLYMEINNYAEKENNREIYANRLAERQ